MFRYDNQFKQTPPATVEYQGFRRKFFDLTREQWDELGYNEAIAIEREPFTTYTTEWVKGDDLICREEVVNAVVDEAAKTATAKATRAVEINAELATLDAFVPRSVEDQIDNADCPILLEHLTVYNQQRLVRKQELRSELIALNS